MKISGEAGVTTGENTGDVFGTFDIGANIVNPVGFSVSGTAGATIFNNDNKNFSSKDIEGQRDQLTVVGGVKGVGKYEYTSGVPSPEGIKTTSHHVAAGLGIGYSWVNLPVSASYSIGVTHTKTFGNILNRNNKK